MLLSSFSTFTPANDQSLRRLLFVARLHAFLVAPLVHDVPSAARTTTVRVIDGVHDFTADLRALSHPPAVTGLSVRDQLVLGVAHGTDCAEAVAVDEAHFGRGHAKRDILTLLGDDLELRARGASHLAARAGLQLDVVHVGAKRNFLQRKRVADAAVRARSGNDLVADGQSLRVQDVALLPVLVLDQRDSRGAIRIVLDLTHGRRHAELVALEVDDPVHALVTTADATHRDVSMIVASAGLGERLHQRLLAVAARDLGKIRDAARARALRDGLELTNSHCLCLENVDRVTVFQGDNRFLPVRTTPDDLSDAAILAAVVRGPDTGHSDAEELFDRRPDVGLGRVRVDAERVFTAILIRRRGLLGDDRSDDGACQCWHFLLPLLLG